MLTHEKEVSRIFQIFQASSCEIRPHFFLTGASGSSKSFTINQLAEKHDLPVIEINAAALTKEGTSGNSLSKAMAPLGQQSNRPVICFVDEFDKLFVSGNHNSDLAHESTNGVQNEFLTVLENDTASVFGDYGKYVNIPVKNVLFVFAGAFNGEEDITLDRLRELGIKTEFLGRVGLVYNTVKVTLDMLIEAAKNSELLAHYLRLFTNIQRKTVEEYLTKELTTCYENNTLGYRVISTLLHTYFVSGGAPKKDTVKACTFVNKLDFNAA